MPDSELYTDLDSVKIYLGLSDDDESADARLEGFIASASRAIDLFCRRRFYAYDETRVFDASALQTVSSERVYGSMRYWNDTARKLWLDRDLISVEEFLNGDQSEILNADYLLYPLNGPPYRWIELRLDRGRLLYWQNTPQAAFSVQGTWGYVTPESEQIVPLATKMWAAIMFQTAQNPGVQSTSIGSFSVSFAAKAMPITDAQGTTLRPPLEIAQMLEGIRFRDYRTTYL